MACVMRPRGAFVGDANGLLDELVLACQVKPQAFGGQREVDARAKSLVPYFSASAKREDRLQYQGPTPAKSRRVNGKETNTGQIPARRRKHEDTAPFGAQGTPSDANRPDVRVAGPGFFSPPTPEQLPLPKLLNGGMRG